MSSFQPTVNSLSTVRMFPLLNSKPRERSDTQFSVVTEKRRGLQSIQISGQITLIQSTLII